MQNLLFCAQQQLSIPATLRSNCTNNALNYLPNATQLSADLPESTPWFPRKMIDLDTFADKVLEMGEELDSDHPGAKDAVYRARRAEITKIAKTYKT